MIGQHYHPYHALKTETESERGHVHQIKGPYTDAMYTEIIMAHKHKMPIIDRLQLPYEYETGYVVEVVHEETET